MNSLGPGTVMIVISIHIFAIIITEIIDIIVSKLSFCSLPFMHVGIL